MSTFDQPAEQAESRDELAQEPGPPLFDRWFIRALFAVFLLSTLTYSVDVFVTSVYLTWGQHLWSSPLELPSVYAQAIFPLALAYLVCIAVGFRAYFKEGRVQKNFGLGLLIWGTLGLFASLWKLQQVWVMIRHEGDFFRFNSSVQLAEGYPYLAHLIWLDGLAWAILIATAGYLFYRAPNPVALAQVKSTGALGFCLWVLLLSRTTHSLSFLIGTFVLYLLFVSRLKSMLLSLEQAPADRG